MSVWIELLVKYLCVRFNFYLNKYLFVLFGVFFFGWDGVFGVFQSNFSLHYKNTFPTVLQELKYEWSHACMFFSSLTDMKCNLKKLEKSQSPSWIQNWTGYFDFILML